MYNGQRSISQEKAIKVDVNISQKFYRIFLFATLPSLMAISQSTYANINDKNGEKIYQEVCVVCHTPGVANAPKLGDKAAWGKLIPDGQVIITAHGYVGIRGMPPKGGRSDLTIAGFSEALNYMVNQSGGNWAKPSKSTFEAIQAEIKIRVKAQENPQK